MKPSDAKGRPWRMFQSAKLLDPAQAVEFDSQVYSAKRDRFSVSHTAPEP